MYSAVLLSCLIAVGAAQPTAPAPSSDLGVTMSASSMPMDCGAGCGCAAPAGCGAPCGCGAPACGCRAGMLCGKCHNRCCQGCGHCHSCCKPACNCRCESGCGCGGNLFKGWHRCGSCCEGSSSCGCSSCGGSGCGCLSGGCASGHCLRGDDGYGLGWRAHSTCDLGHDHYFCSESHGYYYFRPYNYNPIASHQDYARKWNIDTRNPYNNEVFQQIYREVELTSGEETVITDRPAPAEVVPPQKLNSKPNASPLKSGQKKSATRTADNEYQAPRPLRIATEVAREPVRR